LTSTYDQLVKDFRLGLVEGEQIVQGFLLEKYGIKTDNIGGKKLGWDLEVVGVDGSFIGLDDKTFDEKYFYDKFVNKFGKRLEVKRDLTSDRTQNIYFECWSNVRVRNPGCMVACKADTLIFVRKQEFIFLNHASFLAWMFENLFMRTELSDHWRKATFRGGKEQMMSAKNNIDVRGILIPVDDMRTSPACILNEKR
jgi:hypothetical protein